MAEPSQRTSTIDVTVPQIAPPLTRCGTDLPGSGAERSRWCEMASRRPELSFADMLYRVTMLRATYGPQIVCGPGGEMRDITRRRLGK
jgi:hypothetical protein